MVQPNTGEASSSTELPCWRHLQTLPAAALQFLPDSYLGEGCGNIYSCPNATPSSSGWPPRGNQCSKMDLKLHAEHHMMYTPGVKAKKSHGNLILVTWFNSTCKLKGLHLTRPSLRKNHTSCQYIIMGKLKPHKSWILWLPLHNSNAGGHASYLLISKGCYWHGKIKDIGRRTRYFTAMCWSKQGRHPSSSTSSLKLIGTCKGFSFPSTFQEADLNLEQHYFSSYLIKSLLHPLLK